MGASHICLGLGVASIRHLSRWCHSWMKPLNYTILLPSDSRASCTQWTDLEYVYTHSCCSKWHKPNSAPTGEENPGEHSSASHMVQLLKGAQIQALSQTARVRKGFLLDASAWKAREHQLHLTAVLFSEGGKRRLLGCWCGWAVRQGATRGRSLGVKCHPATLLTGCGIVQATYFFPFSYPRMGLMSFQRGFSWLCLLWSPLFSHLESLSTTVKADLCKRQKIKWTTRHSPSAVSGVRGEWWLTFVSGLLLFLGVLTARCRSDRETYPPPSRLTPRQGLECMWSRVTAGQQRRDHSFRTVSRGLFYTMEATLHRVSYGGNGYMYNSVGGKHSGKGGGVLKHSRHSAAFECRTGNRHFNFIGNFCSVPPNRDIQKSVSGPLGLVGGTSDREPHLRNMFQLWAYYSLSLTPWRIFKKKEKYP